MRVLLTGASGFVGANLARRLLEAGHELHLLLRPEHAGWRLEEIRHSVRVHLADLGDRSSVQRVMQESAPTRVFHLAAYGAYPHQTNLDQMVRINIQGTMNLIDAASKFGVETFVNTGSSSEYGIKPYAPAETEWLDSNSSYSWSKGSAAMYCRLAAQSGPMCISTLRLYSVYGPYEEPTRLIPRLIASALQGAWPPLARPSTARDYVHIHDVVNAYLLAAEYPQAERGAIYNIGTGVQTSLQELVALAQDLLSIQAVPQWQSMPDRQWDTNVWISDPRKAMSVLGWEPKTPLKEGFKRMIEWLQATPYGERYGVGRTGPT